MRVQLLLARALASLFVPTLASASASLYAETRVLFNAGRLDTVAYPASPAGRLDAR